VTARGIQYLTSVVERCETRGILNELYFNCLVLFACVPSKLKKSGNLNRCIMIIKNDFIGEI
jgi:hypothetical protein